VAGQGWCALPADFIKMLCSSGVIDVIDDRDGFASVKDNWNAVYLQDPDAQIFLSWDWLNQLFDRRDEAVCILAFKTDITNEDYQAFFPLRKRIDYDKNANRFYSYFSMAGNDWADYTGIVCDPALEQQAISGFGEFLIQMPWHQLYFSCLKMSPQRALMLTEEFSDTREFAISSKSLLDNHGETDLTLCPRIALPDSFEKYLSDSIGANTRQKIRRYARKIQAEDKFAFRETTDQTLNDDLNAFAQYWCERYREIKGSKVYRLADKQIYMLEQAYRSGDLFLHCFTIDNHPVAIHTCYQDREKDTVLFYASARAAHTDNIPAGLVLHAHTIEWAIGQQYKCYDLLRGNEPYKYTLGGKDEQILNTLVERKSRQVKAEFLDHDCLDQALKIMKDIQFNEPPEKIESLYSQLLESWPTETAVLQLYAGWQLRFGQTQYANQITESISHRI